ncbi:EF-hand domain-containing protein [Antarcticimicrobium luteum]|nr:EF-hand domain-containing protein [Antarcticimicrobium luteum]
MKHRHFIAGAVLAVAALGTGAVLAQGQGQMPGPMGGMGMHQRPTFEELDTDQNGTVTAEEMMAHAKGRFDAVDTDGDGKLSLEEMQAQARQRADAMAAQMLTRMDQNGDGVVTFDEMPGQRRESQMERMFSRADADDDGGLSKTEFDRAHARMSERMGGRMGHHKGNHMGMRDGRMMGECGMKGQMGGMQKGQMGDCDGSGRQRMQGNN